MSTAALPPLGVAEPGLSDGAKPCQHPAVDHTLTTGDGESFVVMLFREAGTWQAEILPERLTEDVDGLLAALRQQPSDVPAIGLIDIGDDFFVCARAATGGGSDRLLLSDVTAAAVDELAAQVCERLGVDPPADDEMDDAWPVGDLDVFADLGMEESEMAALLSDLSAYADEQLLALSRRLGFAHAFARVVDVAVR